LYSDLRYWLFGWSQNGMVASQAPIYVRLMSSRETILSEIRRVADNNGSPPGRQVFEKETGIRMSEWHGVYWRSWGDALKEAGYTPNKKQGKLSSDKVLKKYAEAVRHFGRIPTGIDIRMYSRNRQEFPGHTTFTNHFGSKASLDAALSAWVQEHDEFSDLVSLLPDPGLKHEKPSAPTKEGYVYLLKSGSHYKIGRSDHIERRVKEISITLPEEVALEHTIRTDDPTGIEAYWHRRFADKRAKGEWFKLTLADVRAFKRRKFQ